MAGENKIIAIVTLVVLAVVLIFSVNGFGGKVLKCPSSGEKQFMEPVNDKKN